MAERSCRDKVVSRLYRVVRDIRAVSMTVWSLRFVVWCNSLPICAVPGTPFVHKDAHTRTGLASQSGWARVPMSQTGPCVECHEPDFGRLLLLLLFSRLYDVPIFLRPFHHYAIFLLKLFLSAQSSPCNPFSPIIPPIPSPGQFGSASLPSP
jgi:hypothetical protein